MNFERRIQALAGCVCDELEAEAFNDACRAILAELRREMEAGLVQPEECVRLTLCLRHWVIGRAAYILMLRQEAAAEQTALN